VDIACDDAHARQMLEANFAALAHPDGAAAAPSGWAYVVRRTGAGETFSLSCRLEPPRLLDGLDDLLHALEQDLVVSLQHRRPEWLFLHAAVLERGGRAFLLAGDSGSGKSTTAWGLLHHGLAYLSDELAPIEPDGLQVHAYPHALCLKREPPSAFALPPDGVQRLGRTLHVPVDRLPGGLGPARCTVAAIVLVRHDRTLAAPVLRRLRPAEAGARLYAATLNALAHPADGLDVVLGIASRVRCWQLETADLARSCALFLDEVVGAG